MPTFKLFILLLILGVQCYSQSSMISGIDVSFLKQIEDNNGVYKENGAPTEMLQIFKNHGVNYVRLRLWNKSSDGYSNLASTILLAKRIKQKGMRFLLDFHYSDTWADPAHQTKPASWAGLPLSSLKDSIYVFTKKTLLALQQENVLPDMVQIGNEITGGFLWDDGRVGGSFNTSGQWVNFTDLLKQGLRVVQEMNTAGSAIKTMIHVDTGGDTAASKWFFDNLFSRNVQFDYIGLSYYPWWHGTLQQLTANLSMLASRYQKEIIVAETAYPWTLLWNDNSNNIVGQSSQLLPGYAATPAGQAGFLTALTSIIRNTPSHKCIGYFYWEPDWISTSSFGSAWENLALFDFSGNALSSISAFELITAVKEKSPSQKSPTMLRNYPNPFNPSTTVSFRLNNNSLVDLRVFNMLGEEVSVLIQNRMLQAGSHELQFDGKNLNSGIYFCKLCVNNKCFEEVKITLLK